jgi:arginyl-tRNA synthetase
MLPQLIEQLEHHLNEQLRGHFPADSSTPTIDLERPKDLSNGDLTSTIALRSAKILRKAPQVVAGELLKSFEASIQSSSLKEKVEKIEIKGPGFINFFLTSKAHFSIVSQVLREGKDYGRQNIGQNKKVQIEFVSANPTGPLSIAHARQAAVGDALGNIFRFIGFDLKKEFYVNDEGNQINILGNSVKMRALEILGQPITFPEDYYQGDYIKDMAQDFMNRHKIRDVGALEKIPQNEFAQYAGGYLLDVIKKELDDFGVHFDIWTHQSKVATQDKIEKTLEFLKSKDFIYEHEGALWFKSTAFGDDKDRVVKKSDGNFTYLTPDIVYHQNKFDRGFEWILNIWGPDHHGYIPRITAAVEALGHDKKAISVLIVQLATLFRDGQEVSMSTRRGQYVSLREVMQEVGVDASRFFFLMRHISAHLEFDLELAKKQSPENPVYYIQYAHARVYSINKKALEEGFDTKPVEITCLQEKEELELIKKMGEFPESLKFCYDQLDPFPLVSYLQDLATCFHRFYDCHRVVDSDKQLTKERLTLVNSCRIVLENGLNLLGVSAPEKM